MNQFFRKAGKIGGKGLLIGVLATFALVCIFGIVFFVGLWFGPGKDDIALFHGNKYAISKSPMSYDLYEKDKVLILPNVTSYYVGKEKSYIFNNSDVVIIDEKHGNYEKKDLNDATLEEQSFIEKALEIRPSQ
ncbi:hypothetical protein [Paenibacillus sp. B01]|uniref:hypothetical protein n=1 Tax=Paenibacillus sp. B01 TaxID=2660554 RepID=UPI00129A6114|nr:hypothetical protein [Paenibacillus sp. B01]QGG55549.1 hypothetical protein GE073_08230 [Paenibacillus sp. B01]